MKNLYVIIVMICYNLGYSQDANNHEKKIKEVVEHFIEEYQKYEKLTQQVDTIKQNISIGDLKSSFDKLEDKKKELNLVITNLDSLSELIKSSKVYFKANGIFKEDGFNEKKFDDIVKNYSSKKYSKIEDVGVAELVKKTEVYSYFGEGKIINEKVFKEKNTENEILMEVLKNKGKENYFGDISIPKDGQEFYFYKKDEIKEIYRKKKDSLSLPKNERYKFKKLDVEINDGYFSDIKVYVQTDDGNLHLFSNRIGISILDYSHHGRWNQMLFYDISFRDCDYKDSYTDNSLFNLYVKVTDVMGYDYKVGNRYIPQDITFELPEYKDNIQTNKNNRVTYEIKQETYLEKIVELRTYTDFLALFGNSSNGLAQIEGRAKFYLFPYPYRFFGSRKTLGQIEYLPSIAPHVNYSRFDNSNRYVATYDITNNDVNTTSEPLNYGLSRELDLIEKRFLTMGIDLDVFKWQHKKVPLRITLYGLLNYNLSEVTINKSDSTAIQVESNPREETDAITSADSFEVRNVKASGFGFGANLMTKRFNNFGFNYKVEFSYFDYKNFNTFDDLILPHLVRTFKNEAEVFYFPNGNPNQAIFTRLITYNHSGQANNEAFYQFQFGYKFAVGSRAVK